MNVLISALMTWKTERSLHGCSPSLTHFSALTEASVIVLMVCDPRPFS